MEKLFLKLTVFGNDRFIFFDFIKNLGWFIIPDDCDDGHYSRFDAEVSEKEDAYFLILNLNESWTDKHKGPTNDVEEWKDEFIFEIILKVVNVHLCWY